MSAQDESNAIRTPAPAERSVRRRFWRRVILLSLLVLVCGVGGVVFLSRSQPTHWKKHREFLQTHSREQVETLSQNVDRKLLALFDTSSNTRHVSPDGTPAGVVTATNNDPSTPKAAGIDLANADSDQLREIHLTMDEVNAWLHTNLDEWMRERGYDKPAEITNPMMALESGRLIAAFEYRKLNISQIFSASFNTRFLPDGKAALSLQDVTAGRMPVPVGAIGSTIAMTGPDEQAKHVAQWINKLQNVEFRPILKLAPGKKILVTDYKVIPDGIDLTVRLVRPGDAEIPSSAAAGMP